MTPFLNRLAFVLLFLVPVAASAQVTAVDWNYSTVPTPPAYVKDVVNFGDGTLLKIVPDVEGVIFGDAGQAFRIYQGASGSTPIDRSAFDVLITGTDTVPAYVQFGSNGVGSDSGNATAGTSESWEIELGRTFEIQGGYVQFGGHGGHSSAPGGIGGNGGHGTITVNNGGLLKLGTDTTVSLGGTAGSGPGGPGAHGIGALTLQSGGVLQAGKNTVVDATYALNANGGRIVADLTGMADGDTALTVNTPDFALYRSLLVNAVNVDLTKTGSYTLLSAPGADFTGGTYTFVVAGTVNGAAPVGTAVNERYGTQVFSVTTNRVDLAVTADDVNRVVTWTGADTVAPTEWSETAANFSNDDTASPYFKNGDAVVFGANTAEQAVLVANEIRVKSVDNRPSIRIAGNYHFSGADADAIVFGESMSVTGNAEARIDNAFDMSGNVGIEGTLAGAGSLASGGMIEFENGAVHRLLAGESMAIAATNGVFYRDGSTIEAAKNTKIGVADTSKTVYISHGSRIAVDATGIAPGGVGLTILGSVSFYGDPLDAVRVEAVNTKGLAVGEYAMLFLQNGTFSGANVLAGIIYEDDAKLAGANERYGYRGYGFQTVRVEEQGVVLDVKEQDKNRVVYWDISGGGEWNETVENFRNNDADSDSRYFKNGDEVRIDSTNWAGPGTIDIDPAGVRIHTLSQASDFNSLIVNAAEDKDVTLTGGTITGNLATIRKDGTGTLYLNNAGNNVVNVVVNAGILAGGMARNSSDLIVDNNVTVYNGGALSPGRGGSDGNIAVFRAGHFGFTDGSTIFLDLGKDADSSDLIRASHYDGAGYAGSFNFLASAYGTVNIVVATDGITGEDQADNVTVLQTDSGIFLGTFTWAAGTHNADDDETITISVTNLEGDQNVVITTVPGSKYVSSAQTTSTTLSLSTSDRIVPANENGVLLHSAGTRTALDLVNRFSQRYLDASRSAIGGWNWPPESYDADGTILGQCAPCGPVGCGGRSNRLNTWYEGFGNFIDQKRDGTLQGYDVNTYGFQLGVDRRVTKNAVLGLGFSGGFATLKTDDRRARAEMDQYLVTLYGALRRGRWTLAGTVGYAYNDYESRRNELNLFDISGAHRGHLFTGAFELSRRVKLRGGFFEPFLSFNYVNLHENAYTERGGYRELDFASKTTEAYFQTLGVRLSRSAKLRNGWIVSPTVSAGWLHDYGDGRLTTTAAYEGGSLFVVDGVSRNKNRAVLGVKLDAAVNRQLKLFAAYDGQLADGYTSQTAQVGFGLTF